MIYINNENFVLPSPTAVVAGNFDGLHTGHMKLINNMKTAAKAYGLKTAVVSFLPHPTVYFGKTPELKRLLVNEEKKLMLKKHGIDYYIELPFNKKLAELPPLGFFDLVLISKLKCNMFVIGEDFCFGKNRAGNTETARKICAGKRIELNIVSTQNCGFTGGKVSSTLIRELILQRKIGQANGLLGYEYFVLGKASLNNIENPSTTLEIAVSEYKLLPPDGAYAIEVAFGIKTFMCIAKVENRTIQAFLSTCEEMAEDGEVVLKFLSAL